MRWWIGAAICVTLVAAHQPQDRNLYFSGVPEPAAWPTASGDLRLEMVQEFGDQESGLVFGDIVSMAISERGILAVIDRFGCRIWMVDTQAGTAATIGGCGGGPGEFREAVSATFIGDTLLVWDRGRTAMVRLTMDGEEIDRFRVSHFQLGAARLSDLSVGKDGSILAGLNLMPSTTVSEDRQIIVFDSFGGSAVRRGLVSPPIARRTPRNMVRTISLCASTVAGTGETVFALDTWGPQAVILSRTDLKPLSSLSVPVEWARAQEHDLRPGHWGPMSPTPTVICGDRMAVAAYRKQEGGADGVVRVTAAAIVIFDLKDKSVKVIGGDEPPNPGSVLFMTPGASIGNRYFFYTNSFFGYPTIREYRIVHSGSYP